MKILVGCEESQRVTIEFRKRGHEVYSCDIQDCSGGHPEWHIKDDILNHLNDGWDMMIAFPPCTYLCNSGVKHLGIEVDRFHKMLKAADFFKLLWNANINKICLENPIPHGYALVRIKQKYSQIIQPWQFGHGETKATCLWLKNLPKLKPTNIVAGREQRIWKMPKNKDRSKNRSRTYTGIAQALAIQYSGANQ